MKRQEKSFMRKDSGGLRLAITAFFVMLAGGFLYVGYPLTRAGASGEWTIVSTFKGWTLYITSISPGLFVMFLGVVILWRLPEVFKSLEHTASNQTSTLRALWGTAPNAGSFSVPASVFAVFCRLFA